MQHRIPHAMWISLSLSLLLTACSSDGATEQKSNRPVVDPTAALTAQVKQSAPAAESAPEESAQQVSGGAQENPDYLDGITDRNRGDKVGKMSFSGSITGRNGMLYLFETEGRNIAVLDSTRLSNGQFDFGEIEVGRGFYGLGYEAIKKTADIVLNPDEKNVVIDFQNARLVGANRKCKNRAWFATRHQAANKNQIKQLYVATPRRR